MSQSTAVVVGATGSIGGACVQLIAPRVKHVILVARNETRLRKYHESIAAELPCESSYYDRYLGGGTRKRSWC